MSLNIKNEEVHAAVRALAQRLGTSQTSAVEMAVREKLAQLAAAEGRTDRSRRLRQTAAAAQQAYRGLDLRAVEADLYDTGTGLPR